VVKLINNPKFLLCHNHFINVTNISSPLDFFNGLFDQTCDIDNHMNALQYINDQQLITDSRSIIQQYPIPDLK
jgi:hypothetical protein